MNLSWEGIRKSFREFWDKLTRPQKVITVAAPLTVAIVLFSLLFWASRPQYTAIFNNLIDTEAGAITTKLKELGVDYKLANNGTTILVPEKKAAEIRLELANAGLPEGSTFSWQNSFEKMRVGETDADKRLRYILGLQTELETTLKSINGVENARVHLVMPEPSLFVEAEKPATAAVTLQLTPGKELSEESVRAIANLLASSVEGLKKEDVTIVDTQGVVLSDLISDSKESGRLSATQLQLQQAREESIRRSVQSMLDRIYPGQTVVRAYVELDFDQVKTNTHTHNPGVVVSEQESAETITSTTGAGATPGVDTNIPGYIGGNIGGGTSSSESTNVIRNYQVDSTQEERIKNQGDIKYLSVSVLCDADTITPVEAEQIEAVVAAAAGIQVERGDQIQVATLPFDKTSLQLQQQELAKAAEREKLLTYIELGLGALLGLLFLIFIFRMRRKRKKEEPEIPLELTDQLQPVPLAAAEEILLSQKQAEEEAQRKLAERQKKTSEEFEKQKIREAVEEYTDKNPEEVARLVRTWIAEDQ